MVDLSGLKARIAELESESWRLVQIVAERGNRIAALERELAAKANQSRESDEVIAAWRARADKAESDLAELRGIACEDHNRAFKAERELAGAREWTQAWHSAVETILTIAGVPGSGSAAESIEAMREYVTRVSRMKSVCEAMAGALETFKRHGSAIGNDPGPVRYYTDTGYREVPLEDFRQADRALAAYRAEVDGEGR